MTTHGLAPAAHTDQVRRATLDDVNANCAELARGGKVPDALAVVNAWRAAQDASLAAADVLARLATIDKIRATKARTSRRCAQALARRVDGHQVAGELLRIAAERAQARARTAAPVPSWCVATRSETISSNAPPSLAASPKANTR